jgi:hypothetical protein
LTVSFNILVNTGLFSLFPALGLASLLAGLTWLSGFSPQQFTQQLSQDIMHLHSVVRHSQRSIWLIAFIPFALFALLLLSRLLLLPSLGWDSLTYHGLKAGLWVQNGGHIFYDAPGGWAYYRFLFPGGEIFTSWAMLPFHSDLIACLPDLAHWLGLGLVIFTLGCECDAKRHVIVAAICFLLTIPAISWYVGSGYVDIAFTTNLLAALLFLLYYIRSQKIVNLLLAAAALGVATTIKISAISYIGFFGIVLFIWTITSTTKPYMLWQPLLYCSILYLMPIGPWLLANFFQCGYPLGTIPITIFQFRLSLITPNLAWFFDRPDLRPYQLSSELHAFFQTFNKLTLPSIAAVSLGLIQACVMVRNYSWVVALSIATVFAAIFNYFQPSFSLVRLVWPDCNGRFLAPALILLTVLSLNVVKRAKITDIAYSVFLYVSVYLNLLLYSIRFLWPSDFKDEIFILPVLFCLLMACVLVLCLLPRLTRQRQLVTSIGIILFLAFSAPALQLVRDWFRPHAYSRSTVLVDFPRYWVPALKELEYKPKSKSIAITAGPRKISHQWFVYPFLGSQLQNRICYVPTTEDGHIVPHHPDYLKKAKQDYKSWLNRLIERSVTHVMSFKPRTTELQWMENHSNQFTRLVGDGTTWGLYSFKRRD